MGYQVRLWGGRDVCCDTERSRCNYVRIGTEVESGTQIAQCAQRCHEFGSTVFIHGYAPPSGSFDPQRDRFRDPKVCKPGPIYEGVRSLASVPWANGQGSGRSRDRNCREFGFSPAPVSFCRSWSCLHFLFFSVRGSKSRGLNAWTCRSRVRHVGIGVFVRFAGGNARYFSCFPPSRQSTSRPPVLERVWNGGVACTWGTRMAFHVRQGVRRFIGKGARLGFVR